MDVHRENPAVTAVLAEYTEIDARHVAFIEEQLASTRKNVYNVPWNSDTEIGWSSMMARQLFVFNKRIPVSLINITF